MQKVQRIGHGLSILFFTHTSAGDKILPTLVRSVGGNVIVEAGVLQLFEFFDIFQTASALFLSSLSETVI